MRFTDLGFIFILLPLAAVCYYCCPKKARPAALFFISALFFLLEEPYYIWLFAALIPDFIFASRADRIEPQKRILPCRLIILKNAAIAAVWGVILPIVNESPAPIGVILFCITSIEFSVIRSREAIRPCGFFESAASVTFFARMQLGPVGGVRKLISQLQMASPSLSSISRGAMLIICGAAKRVILAEQLFVIFRSIADMPTAYYSTALGWLCAGCGAAGIYFTLSAYSDIARGIANVFSVTIPRTVYFPFQAKSLRDYIYRLNMPMEDTLNRMLLHGARREEGTTANYFISSMMPVIIAILIYPSANSLLWAIYLAVLIFIDWLILRRIPVFMALPARIVTFLITLPSYILLLPTTLYNRLYLISALLPGEAIPLINDDAIYLLTTNAPLLFVALICCTSAIDALSRITEKQLPQLWWIISALSHAVLFVLTVSFLLWNVR